MSADEASAALPPAGLQANAEVLPQPLAAQARAQPEAVALQVDGGAAWTFAALAATVQKRAGQLRAAGVAPGDRVALAAAADADGVLWLQALWWLGACAVPLPVRGTAADCAVRLEVTAPAYALLQGAGGGVVDEALRAWARAGASDDQGAPDVTGAEGATSEAGGRARLIVADALPPVPAATPQLAACGWPLAATLARITTSGSTGRPKPVDLCVRQVVFSAFGSATRLGHLPGDTWLLTLPLHHVGGLSVVWRSLLLGARLHVVPQFAAARVAQLLASGEVALASLVPTMLAQILDAAPELHPSPRLRAVLLGGAPTPPPLLARALARKLPVAVTWGMSEAASQIATRWPSEAAATPGDAGPPLPFAEVAAATDGRLWVAGPVVGAPLRSADVGIVDATGRVQVVGRSDDVFVSGGENVDPGPIEAHLQAHPAIAEAAIVGAPDAVWGQRAVAHLVLRPGQTQPTAAALLAFCRERLASFQLPVQFVWHVALPRDALGKLRRRELSGNARQA